MSLIYIVSHMVPKCCSLVFLVVWGWGTPSAELPVFLSSLVCPQDLSKGICPSPSTRRTQPFSCLWLWWEQNGKVPSPWGSLPSLVASIFSASPGSSWRNRLVIRVFIFPAVSDVGKSRMLRLERFRAAVKDVLGRGLGAEPSGHWVPACRKTKQDGPGTAKPSGVFNLPQPWRLSKLENSQAQLNLKIVSQNITKTRRNSFPESPSPTSP